MNTGFYIFNAGCLPDQRGVARPLGKACDIGAYQAKVVKDYCYVVKASNNKVVNFWL